ncbi:MAG: hypothetical protein HOQ11_15525 [Gemmatimonadaceae bacterium]|nr:hypothetical protein [Gemmatimonadaceae bacterium]NUQ91782.1 hypothetical protein [Gemmatimonadaceae bacterium]NUR21259.1 hypothetical protein [Gemmatimonadaceae bacterium]NUS98812.1 hypothetical protein [Gemmatimonadaceae bacterium]
MQYKIRFVTGLAALSLAAACADTPVGPGLTPDVSLSKRASASGTVLSATTTATGFREDRLEYDWTVKKTLHTIFTGPYMTPEEPTGVTTVTPTDPKWLEYRVEATRNEGTRYSATGVRGEVCVTNGGAVATEGLTIADVVRASTGSGPYQDFVARAVDVSGNPVLAAGEKHCYPYEIAFAAAGGTQYRSTARVTITNHSGYLGQPFGPGAGGSGLSAGFTIPETSVAVTRDASAALDEQIVPACTNMWPSVYCSWAFAHGPNLPASITQSATFDFMVDLNNYAACDEEFPLKNSVALTESGPRESGEAPQVRRDSTTLLVRTMSCPPKPANPGCTLTVGYWKNHAWPSGVRYTWEPEPALNFFDSGITWKNILSTQPRGDAYLILAHQYVAARLNQLVGHSYVPPEVNRALKSAHDYFALSPDARALVSRDQVIAWASLLDRYNNGGLGVPHCG